MKKQVVFVHGGGESAYETDALLADSLRRALGTGYRVHYPAMPNEGCPAYEAWKDVIAAATGCRIFVGHSFGASILIKYLSETVVAADGVFLIATPYWGIEDWEVDEYTLREATALSPEVPVFLYHSLDDEIVPFEHLWLYAARLPQATIREFSGRDHQFNHDLSEVARDIKGL